MLVHNLVKRYYCEETTSRARGNAKYIPALRTESSDVDDIEFQGRLGNQNQSSNGLNAVKGTSFGVKRGEVFSLLGVNGAGKSSTFDCIVGRQRVSGGTVLLDGVNVSNYVNNPTGLHGIVGYCP